MILKTLAQTYGKSEPVTMVKSLIRGSRKNSADLVPAYPSNYLVMVSKIVAIFLDMFTCRIDDELELRMIEPHHATELNKLVRDNYDHICEWSDWLTEKERPLERTKEWIGKNLASFAAGEGYEIGIWLAGKMVGQVGYSNIAPQDRKAEIGYWLAADAQGKGVVTKACRALISNAFDTLNIHRIEIRCGTENHKSRRVTERLGAQFEGTARHAEWLHDSPIDLAVYSILETEWESPARSD